MTYRKMLFSGLTSFCLLTFGACTSDNTISSADNSEPTTAKVAKKQDGYVKPGAAVQFSHNYDGKTEPGEVESFQVFVKGGDLLGNVDVKMENTVGLKIYNNTMVAQKSANAGGVQDGSDQTMNVSVGAQAPGRYYLKFVASADKGDGNPMLRSFVIAIQVGDQPYVPELGTGMTAEETPTGEKIITMEAQETIEN